MFLRGGEPTLPGRCDSRRVLQYKYSYVSEISASLSLLNCELNPAPNRVVDTSYYPGIFISPQTPHLIVSSLYTWDKHHKIAMPSHKRQGSPQIQDRDRKRTQKAPEEPPDGEPAGKAESKNLMLKKLPPADPERKIGNSKLEYRPPFELPRQIISLPSLFKEILFLDLADEFRKTPFLTFEDPSFVEPSDEEIKGKLTSFQHPPHVAPTNALSQGAGVVFPELIPHTRFTIAAHPPSILEFGIPSASQDSITATCQQLCYCCQFLVRVAIIKCVQDNSLAETEVISLSKRRYHVKPLRGIGLCDMLFSHPELQGDIPLYGLFRVAIVVVDNERGRFMILSSNAIAALPAGLCFSLSCETSVASSILTSGKGP
jgi:hypothetical protein